MRPSTKPGRNKKIKTFDGQFWWYFGVFCCLIFLISWFPYWLTQFSLVSYSFGTPNEVGDTIGGTFGPFVALVASALTFLAFWVQFKANQQQRLDISIERFENKYYELLRLHRANVEEMNIADRIKGRKCFARLFYEFKAVYLIVEREFQNQEKKFSKVGDATGIDLLKLAYTIYFFGVGHNSEKQYTNTLNLKERELFDVCKKIFVHAQLDYLTYRSKDKESRFFTIDLFGSSTDDRVKIFYYLPFDGHGDRLGHYYRHLFQTVKYILEQSDDFLSDEEKYGYIKTLRAQLSNHEQILLYYNATAWFRKEWREAFVKFRMIENMPVGLADFGITPLEQFKKEIGLLRNSGIEMFEEH